ncbi:acyl-CoA dehydrogenase family protein [Cryptosporangium sp. NPDC051539]|uniref:acyl-CoA dehydrogenase family protein n=1 Tax=Cryptosporangium sp. NPDC051539 TaxID=3363962 RepID=UPI0037959B12
MDASFGIYRLAEEHGYVRDAVREIADEVIAPHAAEVDDQARFPEEAREALTRAGFHAVHVPKEYDGEGADAITGAIVVEEVARVCASSSLIPAVNKLGSTPVILSGSDELKREVLPPLARGEAMFSYALSEREAGSDPASMTTRAVRDGENWVINGTKAWITNSGISTYYTVMAKTDPTAGARGISAFVVHKDDPGFSVGTPERKLGIKGSPTCEVYFENCTVPLHRIVGEPGTGFATAMRTLDHTRLAIGAQAVGIAQGAFEVARDYVKQRKQFGRSIADFQSLQFMLADMAMKIESARQLVYVAAAKAERGEPDLTFFSASAKVLASDTAMSVTTDAVQLLGGAGYTKDFPVERMMRDAKITQIYEGTNQINRIVMARQLLK